MEGGGGMSGGCKFGSEGGGERLVRLARGETNFRRGSEVSFCIYILTPRSSIWLFCRGNKPPAKRKLSALRFGCARLRLEIFLKIGLAPTLLFPPFSP